MLGNSPVSPGRAALREPAAAKEAQELELALGVHLFERLLVREIHYLNDQTVAEMAE